MRRLNRTMLVAVLATMCWPLLLLAQTGGAEWFLSTGPDLEGGTRSVRLGSGPSELTLLNGWRCAATPLSPRARVLSCEKSGEAVEASVDCGYGRKEDHTQLRFRTEGGPVEFVELSCGPPPAAFVLYRNSATDPDMRLLVASFNADESAAYNRENCEIAQSLFSRQPGVTVRYWCEGGGN